MRRLLGVFLALFAATASAQVVPMSGAGGSSSGSVPGGTITCGSAAQACTFNAPYTAGAADFNTDNAATGGVDTGFQFDVLGDFGAADFTFKVRDNGGLNDVFKTGGIGSIWLGPGTPAAVGTLTVNFQTTDGTAAFLNNIAATGGVDTAFTYSAVGDLTSADFIAVWRDASTTVLASISGAGSFVTIANVVVGGAQTLEWLARSEMYSSANGIIELTANSAAAFTRLNFGGTTEAFPAISTTAAISSKAQGLIIQPADGVAAVFADLGATTDGAMIYCSDCKPTTAFVDSTCTSAGSGAYAIRLNGAWKCTQ